MPISANYDSILFARRCVAAHFLGREEGLRLELSYAKVEVTVDEIIAHGQAWTAAFRMDDIDKDTCFLCGDHRPAGTLCACFKAVMPHRHYNVHDALMMQKLPPDTLVETYVCTCCGDLAEVYAGHADNAHRRFKAYKPRKWCELCFRDQNLARPPRGRRGGKKRGEDRPSKAFKAELDRRLTAPSPDPLTTHPNTGAPT